MSKYHRLAWRRLMRKWALHGEQIGPAAATGGGGGGGVDIAKSWRQSAASTEI